MPKYIKTGRCWLRGKTKDRIQSSCFHLSTQSIDLFCSPIAKWAKVNVLRSLASKTIHVFCSSDYSTRFPLFPSHFVVTICLFGYSLVRLGLHHPGFTGYSGRFLDSISSNFCEHYMNIILIDSCEDAGVFCFTRAIRFDAINFMIHYPH